MDRHSQFVVQSACVHSVGSLLPAGLSAPICDTSITWPQKLTPNNDNDLKHELSQPEISQLFPSVNPSWCSDLQGLTTQSWIAGRPDREC